MKRLTPDAVAKFVYLHMKTEDGAPIYPAAHHWLWLELMCNFEIQKLLIIAPPESAKTTWVVGYIACHIAFWPESPRILASVTGPVATTRSLAIRNIMDSAEFQETFPEVQQAKGLDWQKDRWCVAPDGVPHSGRIHATVAAYGTGGSIVGARAREAIFDDIHDTDNSRTQHQRDFVGNWVHQEFLSRSMSRVGRQIGIGTRWHMDDTYGRSIAQGDWVTCHLPLLSSSNDVYATIHYPDNYKGARLGEPIAGAAFGSS